MKIIDLLNKIANGEEAPKKIKKDKCILKLIDDVPERYYALINNNGVHFGEFYFTLSNLNDEIEIIEEPKKIKKLKYDDLHSWVIDTINEIIDYINKGDSNDC